MPDSEEQKLLRAARERGVARVVSSRTSPVVNAKDYGDSPIVFRVPSMTEEQRSTASGPSDDELRSAARENERIVQGTRDEAKRLEGQIVLQRIYDELERRGRVRERGMFGGF